MLMLKSSNAHAQIFKCSSMLNYLDKSQYLQCYKPDGLECYLKS